MKRSDRRTFLRQVAGASGLVAASAALPELASPASAASATGGPGAPSALTVNGLAPALGVDPDALFFAWRVNDPRRGARQGAARVQVTAAGSGPEGAAVVWDTTVHSAQQAFVPYGGPALAGDGDYVLRVATADRQGRMGPFTSLPFVTGLRDADWGAQWLQPAAAAVGPDLYRYLRRTTALPAGTVRRATAYVAAAHKYRLHVNGTEVDSGPSFSYPDESYYQATDVTAFVRPGRTNVIGALHHWYGPGKGRPTSAPGFLAHVSVRYTDGRHVVVGTDGRWTETPGEWLPAPQRNNTNGDFVEDVDGRLSPLGWSEPSYDDAGWTPVTVLGPVGTAPFTALYAQRTRITEQPVAPVSVRTLPDGAVVVDFGKVYAARPTVAFRNGLAGRTVQMHVGYLLDDDGHVSAVHGTQMTNLSFSYIQRGGAEQFVPYTFIGFRYLEIDGPGEPIAADQVVALARHAALPESQVASFSSGNQTLDRLFAVCVHSCTYTSHEQFIDTPTREKGPFLWDSSQESMAVMRTYAEQNLTFQGLRDFARSQARFWPDGGLNGIYPNSNGVQDYPTFTALYPEWVWQYYVNTGDVATMTALYPTLQRLGGYFSSFEDPSTGLLANLVDSEGDDNSYGFDFSVVASGPVNILAANAYRHFGAIAQVVGDRAGAAGYTRQAAALASAVNAHLTRPDGVYVDGLRPGGVQSPQASQVTNVLALTYGLVPGSRLAAVGAHVRSLGISVSPQNAMQLLQALHAAGLDADVVSLLTDASIPGWASILRQGATFMWEVWQPSDVIGDGMSHGWGSSTLVAMQGQLLGVSLATPVVPGTATVTVAPPRAGIGAASGSVPTLAGPVAVQWRRQGTGATVDLRVPPNVTATVAMPATAASRVTEGGRPLTAAPGIEVVGAAGGVVTLRVGAGSYALVSS